MYVFDRSNVLYDGGSSCGVTTLLATIIDERVLSRAIIEALANSEDFCLGAKLETCSQFVAKIGATTTRFQSLFVLMSSALKQNLRVRRRKVEKKRNNKLIVQNAPVFDKSSNLRRTRTTEYGIATRPHLSTLLLLIVK